MKAECEGPDFDVFRSNGFMIQNQPCFKILKTFLIFGSAYTFLNMHVHF